jgi:hypothetical protein
MLASFQCVRMGMTPSEVRAAVGQVRADEKAWCERGTLREHWEVVEADEEVPANGDGEVKYLEQLGQLARP